MKILTFDSATWLSNGSTSVNQMNYDFYYRFINSYVAEIFLISTAYST